MANTPFDFKNLDFNNIQEWPTLIKKTAIGVAGILVFILGFFIIDNPQYKALSRANLEELDDKQQLSILIPQVIDQNKETVNAKQLKKILVSYSQKLPKPEQLGEVLDDLTRLSVNNQLNLLLLKPEAIQQEDFYARVPINLEVTGEYVQLVNFMNQVAHLNYYLYPHQMFLGLASAKKNPGSKVTAAATDTLFLQMTTDMYYFSPKPKTEGENEKKH